VEKQPQISLSRGLRLRQTEDEKMRWVKLRDRQLNGVKFRRQQLIGSYIVDLVSFEEKLIIEIDGGQHNKVHKIEEDEKRMDWLEGEGFFVLRFWNNDVLLNIESVLGKIKEVLESNSHPHLTSPIEGEVT
jgi:very-short-patch-repair endonuclease